MRSQIRDTFQGRADPHWNRFAVGVAAIEEGAGSIRLVAGPCGGDTLSDAELNDHRLSPRGHWHWKPPLRLTVRARASHPAEEMHGTAGFGFWNSPFGIDASAEDSPQAVWFFHAAPPSFMSMNPSGHGTGWRSQVLNVPRVPKVVLFAGGAAWALLKPLRPAFYRLAQTQVGGGEAPVPERFDVWHTYQIEWRGREADFRVDGRLLFSSDTAPAGPLGFCAWVDNSMLDVRGEHFGSGYVSLSVEQWLELSEVRIEPLSPEA